MACAGILLGYAGREMKIIVHSLSDLFITTVAMLLSLLMKLVAKRKFRFVEVLTRLAPGRI